VRIFVDKGVMKMEDYYGILDIPKDATLDQIKAAYRDLAIRLHPDRNMDKPIEERRMLEEDFKKINEAYAVLSDQTKRRDYDSYGKEEFAKRYTEDDIFSGFDYKSIIIDLFANIDIFASVKGNSDKVKRARTYAAINAIVDGGILLFMYLFRDRDTKEDRNDW